MNKPTIGIDCRLAGVQHAGIGRYIQNLIQRCVEDDRFQWVLFFHDRQQAVAVLPGKLSQVTKVYLPIKHYSFKEQLVVPWVLLKYRLDLLHVPHFNIPLLYPRKMLVTIHDLLWHEQRGASVTTLPAWQYWFKYLAYRFTTHQAVNRAKKIIVPSKTVSSTLQRYYPAAKAKTIVIPEGVEQLYRQAKRTASSKTEKVLVCTGSMYPHKNLRLVVQALALLPEFKLVLVGSRSAFQQDIEQYVKNHQLDKRVEFAGYLSDQELVALYRSAYALVFPSLSEGFGLPGLEAMAVGLPVIAANIPIFREIYQDAAAYFDPYSVAELVETVRTLEPSRKTLITAGRKRAKNFDWVDAVAATLQQYATVLS